MIKEIVRACEEGKVELVKELMEYNVDIPVNTIKEIISIVKAANGDLINGISRSTSMPGDCNKLKKGNRYIEIVRYLESRL